MDDLQFLQAQAAIPAGNRPDERMAQRPRPPAAERKDVSAFVAHPEKGEGRSIASLKGKVVLVGLWSKNCDPSAKMLLEMASVYPKRDAAGFEILAVNFDENQQEGGIEGGWRAINKFRTKNRAFFESSQMPVYTPGLGKEGPSNFMEMVMSLPALFVVDRAGRLAEIHIGYKDGYVGEALKRVLRERAAAAPVAAPPTAPARAPLPVAALAVVAWVLAQATWQEFAACGAVLALAQPG